MSEFNKMMNKKAVALQYDENRDLSPVIVATGSGYLAEKIIEVAGENHIPVYEDNSLASVLSRLELGSNIPMELYEAVVDIYVFFLKYSPKAKQHFQDRAMRDDMSQSEEPAAKAASEMSLKEAIAANENDKDSIEYQTRELLRELSISSEDEPDTAVKAIPWLPEEF